jgi:hypothetical protein
MGYSSFSCDIYVTILRFSLFYTITTKEYFMDCIFSQKDFPAEIMHISHFAV